MKICTIIAWICRVAAAVILLQTLFFKFTAAPESVYIFTKVGLEPYGRIGSGVAELIAAILILIPATTWLGAGLALAVMFGAILSHLTVLGVQVMGDGGLLFSLAETQRILSAYHFIPTPFLDCPINVRSLIGHASGESPLIASTVGRELMYAVAHTIHHYALIAVMCGLIDVPVPDGFGVAPSTLRYRSEQQKAA